MLAVVDPVSRALVALVAAFTAIQAKRAVKHGH